MNPASKLLSSFSLALLAAASVQAETYEGTTKVTSTQDRAVVRAQGKVESPSLMGSASCQGSMEGAEATLVS